MVNGWCFGGAFNSLIACDLAIAAEEATFGLSEINWGIIPGRQRLQERSSSVINQRDALYYTMTGETVRRQARRPRWASSTRRCRWRACASA